MSSTPKTNRSLSLQLNTAGNRSSVAARGDITGKSIASGPLNNRQITRLKDPASPTPAAKASSAKIRKIPLEKPEIIDMNESEAVALLSGKPFVEPWTPRKSPKQQLEALLAAKEKAREKTLKTAGAEKLDPITSSTPIWFELPLRGPKAVAATVDYAPSSGPVAPVQPTTPIRNSSGTPGTPLDVTQRKKVGFYARLSLGEDSPSWK